MLAGKAASIGFALRGGELYTLTNAAVIWGKDNVGEFVEYDAEFNKNHACDMSASSDPEPRENPRSISSFLYAFFFLS